MDSHKPKAPFLPHPASWLEIQHRLTETRRRVDDETMDYYEGLNDSDRKGILDWLRQNFEQLPFPTKLKAIGLQKLGEGDYCFPPALLLIRQAVRAIGTETAGV